LSDPGEIGCARSALGDGRAERLAEALRHFRIVVEAVLADGARIGLARYGHARAVVGQRIAGGRGGAVALRDTRLVAQGGRVAALELEHLGDVAAALLNDRAAIAVAALDDARIVVVGRGAAVGSGALAQRGAEVGADLRNADPVVVARASDAEVGVVELREGEILRSAGILPLRDLAADTRALLVHDGAVRESALADSAAVIVAVLDGLGAIKVAIFGVRGDVAVTDLADE
jgi:hypothetical protein